MMDSDILPVTEVRFTGLWFPGPSLELRSGKIHTNSLLRLQQQENAMLKLLKMKGSGAEARAVGPFLQWQNRSGEAAKSAERERGDPSPTPRGKAGGAGERQL